MRGTLRGTVWFPRWMGGRGSLRGGDEPSLLHVTGWIRKRLGSSMAAQAANFPWTREMVGPYHSAVDACIPKVPHPTIYTLQ